jgi:tetratricopeptide (TPR) repeat protein
MRFARCVLLSLAVLAAAPGAMAKGPSAPTEEAIRSAKGHFDRAQDAYRRGAYRDAVDELEAAIRLDPTSKDLEYNLGLVYEKLGDIDQAIQRFRRFREMETDPQEITKVDRVIARLRGARDAIDQTTTVPVERAKTPIVYRPTIVVKEAPRSGKLDTWTYTAAGVAGAAAIVGTVFGVLALAERPRSDERTGGSTSAAKLQERAETAHQNAVVADVAFLVSAVALGGTAWLYFGRDADDAPKTTAAAVVTSHGGAVSFGVSF